MFYLEKRKNWQKKVVACIERLKNIKEVSYPRANSNQLLGATSNAGETKKGSQGCVLVQGERGQA